jgi:gliding motility-associated-like protein
LGSLFNDDEEQIVIESVIEPLAYSITVSNQNCSQGGQITLTPTSGTISQCEIISGPVTRPLQTSNVFSNLPVGTYNIRVFDDCGEGVVTTYTLALSNADLTISESGFSESPNNSCDSVTVENTISVPEGSTISYPITVQYTIHPSNGEADIVITQQYTSGDPMAFEVSQEMPLFGGSQFSYDVQVTDNCNAVFTNNGIIVNPVPNITLTDALAECGQKYLEVAVSNFKAPLTVNFVAAPETFNATAYNAAHPGPFNTGSIQYGGMENPVPAGTYIIEVTDACGRTASDELLVEEVLPPPVTLGRNNGCFATLGNIRVSVPGRDIVSAVIIVAPSIYEGSLPDDVSDFIEDGKLRVTDLPLGTYQVTVTDSCGMEYTVTIVVPPFVESDFTATAIPFCTEGIGSVQLTSGNGPLVTVSVVSAPQSFTESLPFDASPNIMSGIFFMGDLPEGNYEFTATDVCGIQKTVSAFVTGYHPDAEPFTYVPNCGSFEIVMSDNDTTSAETTYWMQKKHPLTGLWGHPETGAAYEEGLPTNGNSYPLQNNTTNYNLLYSGTFRIVKSFKSFVSGEGEHYCIEAWEPFTYNMNLQITNAYTLGCAGNPDDVVIEAQNGLAPYSYRIIKKDGQNFVINNGNNNVFSGLTAAVYDFEVTDACGNIDVYRANINSLPSLVTANEPSDILLCTDTGAETNHIFDLQQQTATILGDQHPESYTVTYHLTAEDADNNINSLPNSYANISNPQTLYARVIHNSVTICHDVVSFNLYVNQNPLLSATTSHMCEGEPVVLSAESGFDSYLWSTGETTQTIMVDELGTYSVTVKEIIGESYCENTYDITVEPSGAATIVSLDIEDWTYDQNTITVHTSGQGNYEYSLDGVTYQDSPTFADLLIGNYTVYVRDKNGCGITKDEVLLLNYPNFFTPNGDGTHDKWRIKYAYMEPEMQINIFDRFGKLLISLDPESDGWDGTFNGAQLPSTDYWFVVTRANGQVHKGHFSMKR